MTNSHYLSFLEFLPSSLVPRTRQWCVLDHLTSKLHVEKATSIDVLLSHFPLVEDRFSVSTTVLWTQLTSTLSLLLYSDILIKYF